MQNTDYYPKILIGLPLLVLFVCNILSTAALGEPLKSTSGLAWTSLGLGTYWGMLWGMGIERYRQFKKDREAG